MQNATGVSFVLHCASTVCCHSLHFTKFHTNKIFKTRTGFIPVHTHKHLYVTLLKYQAIECDKLCSRRYEAENCQSVKATLNPTHLLSHSPRHSVTHSLTLSLPNQSTHTLTEKCRTHFWPRWTTGH